ncbi:MAG: lysylphosphatidylglycerol synthase transmembrane domain-containing protein [Pseudomonadota bacterium]
MSKKTVPDGGARSSEKKPYKRTARQILGFLLAGACLAWVFHDIDYRELLQNMSAVNWWWILPAVVLDILSYVCQGLRWQLLLRHFGRITTFEATKAIYAGLFLNEIIPLRVGELVRTYIVSRWLSIKFISAIPSVVVERLFDAIWLGAGIGITAIVIQVPENLMAAADNIGIAVLLATGMFLYLIVFRKQSAKAQGTGHIRWKPLRMAAVFFNSIADEIQVLGTSRFFYFSFVASSLILVMQILAFWFVMLAYGLTLSLWIGTAVLLLLHLGTVLPNAPSNVGTYQLLCVVGLAFFGVDKTVAAAFSVVVFIILTLPLWAVGLFAIGRCGMTLQEIRMEIRKSVKHYSSI